jgi:hypothetical protein
MIAEQIYLRNLVDVDADFKPSVQLPFDFDQSDINERLIRTFIPTTQSIDILTEIAHSLNPNSSERARTLVGTFGTGKSDLLLVICNYFSRQLDDPIMQPFYGRLHEIDPTRAGIIRQRRENHPPFLVVLLQADTVSPFPGFVLHGLQQALARQGLADLMDRTKYDAAREQIETWQNEQHPRYADFCKVLQDHEGRDINSLLTALAGAQADMALPVFQRAFRTVTGTEFNIYGYSQPHETYASVAQSLVATGRYSGILLVCDEFTSFLEHFQRAIDQQFREIDAETKAVENLAERSASSGKAQIHFIVASLESFAAAAENVGAGSVSKAVERVGGRFKQHSLMVEGSEELIRGAIKRQPGLEHIQRLPQAQRDDLLTVAEKIWGRRRLGRDWMRDVIIDGAFPLHPITTYALPLINLRVAQSQRTMFLFLKDDQGLRGFIQREQLQDTYPNWHRLLTPDLLFDYFYESIVTKRSDIAEAYENARQRLQVVKVDTTLAERLLKIVALCEVVTDFNLSPTHPFLRCALNLPPEAENDLDSALQVLEQVEALNPPNETESGTGIYSLPMHGRISSANLRQRINNRAQNLTAPSVNQLQAQYQADPIAATKYNSERNSWRQISAYYVDLSALRSNQKLQADLNDIRNRDALLWYVVASTDSERSEAQSLARELTKQAGKLIVAVPNAPSQILSAFKNYQALEELRKDPELDPAARPYLADAGQVGKEYKSRLDGELRKLQDPKQWEWFADGHGRSALGQAQITDRASRLMEKLFPDTPNTNLRQQFKPDDISLMLTRAVDQLIKGDIKLETAAKGTIENILRQGIMTLGLIQLEQKEGSYETYSVVSPERSNNFVSRKIWQYINDHFKAGKSLSLLAKNLRQSPFGLYDSILIVFLAAFIVRNADSVEIKLSTGPKPQALNIDTSLLKKILDRPQDYTLLFQPLSEQESKWLRGIVERGLRRELNVPRGTTLRMAVVAQLRNWLSRLPLPSFAENLTEEQLHEFLPNESSQVISVMRLLLQPPRSESELAASLLNELPGALGDNSDHAAWTDTQVDELLGRFGEVCAALIRLPLLIKEQAVVRIASIFDAGQYAPESRWNVIFKWRRNRDAIPGNATSGPSLQHQARLLFRLTHASTGSVEEALLDEFARQVIGIGLEYQRWPTWDRLDKLEQEISKAKREIEEKWQQVASVEEIWLQGLARAASGREMTGVSADEAARQLALWSNSVTWPACAKNLSVEQVQQIFSELSLDRCRDVTFILARANYDEQHWRDELLEVLPKQFGSQSWHKQAVQEAIDRFTVSVNQAARLESQLRRHILARNARCFVSAVGMQDMPLGEVLQAWRSHYNIPEPNDLSSEAKGLLFHVGEGLEEPETLFLVTLPRALATVAQPYRQWTNYSVIDNYVQQLEALLHEIDKYEPTTQQEYTWLTGIIRDGLHGQLAVAPREKHRLISVVAEQLSIWLQQKRLPTFALALSDAELASVFSNSEPIVITATSQLVQSNFADTNGTVDLLLHKLPETLGITSASDTWVDQDVNQALLKFKQVCELVISLPKALRRAVLNDVGHIFCQEAILETETDLLGYIREWRAAYVILPDEQLSPDARLLYDNLALAEEDMEGVLLERLPARIGEVHASYGQWKTWETKNRYITALSNAAKEIASRGQVNNAGNHVQVLWEEFCEQLKRLSNEDRRWIVKAFRDEFRQ